MSQVFGFLVATLALMGSITCLTLNSPCPELFHYDSLSEPGKWTGTVTLLSDANLHGVWLRLIFDRKLNGILIGDNFGEVVSSPDKLEFLIKNREYLLKAATPRSVQITVKYEGDKAPRLIGYRLNAKMVCSTTGGHLPFGGDSNSGDFLAFNTPTTSAYKEIEGCGTAPLKSKPYPWHAAIYYQSNNTGVVCEGSLITSRHILTAAHCVTYQKTELPVNNNHLKIGFGSGEAAGVSGVVLHPGYRAKGLLNDIALIQLDSPLTLNDYIRPICLGESSGENHLLSGYKVPKSSYIGQAQVQPVECPSLENLQGFFTDNVGCLHYTGGTDCVGGSGSALITSRNDSKSVWELNGVVTVGVALQNKYECGRSSVVLFADVSRYLKWIQAVIA